MSSKEIKNLAIVLRPKSNPKFDSMIENLCQWLLKRKVNISFLVEEEKRILKNLSEKTFKKIKFIETKDFNKQDAILSLGGDGTLIGLCRKIKSRVPIIGVNWGKLGFITEFSAHEMYDALQDILKGKFEVTKQHRFMAKVYRKDKVIFKSHFVNDAVISNNEIARMFDLNIECGDEIVFGLSGDGLIISSPLGSTAYSLAAGGPIVHPQVSSMILTPICAHGLTYRPMVLGENNPVSVSLKGTSSKVILTIDGQESHLMSLGDRIVITKNKTQTLSFIKNPNRSYFQTLKEKLMLNKRGV